MWNQQFKTDRPSPNNNEKGKCLLIDGEFSGDRRMIKKEAIFLIWLPCNRRTACVEYKNINDTSCQTHKQESTQGNRSNRKLILKG